MENGCQILVASHNEESINKACKIIDEKGVKGKVSFAQLLGLADHLTAKLKFEKKNVAKYIPFGPCDTMIPFFIRRA